MGTYGWMETFWQDMRLAVRGLKKSPGFLTVVVVSLALGIGANSTIFSMLNALLYRPLPYEHPEQLTVIWQTEKEHPGDWQAPPIAELMDWKKEKTVFQDIALTSFTEEVIMSRSGEPEPIHVQYVTPNFFGLLGVQPIRGRVFTADEMQDHSYAVVISSAFWKNHFNNDPEILGKTLTVDSVPSTVVGVMPPGFAPFYGGRLDLWVPVNPESARYSERIDHWLMPVGRLRTGATVTQAQAEMDVIAKQLEIAYPKTNRGVEKLVRPLHKDLYQWAGQALYPLLGAVSCVLLIACVNVANLMKSRTETRRKEYSVRAALGAGRRRLMQQLFAESGLLAFLGGGLGILLAYWGIQILRKLLGDFPNVESIGIDGRVLLFTLGISVLTAGSFGLAPALQASNPDLNAALREGEGRTVAGSRGITRHILAVSEVALAMVLLVGAGLMINTILRLEQVNPGFDPRNLLTMLVQLPEGGKYLQRVPGGDMEKTLPTVAAFNQQLTERIAALPGVASSGIMSFIPMRGAYTFSFSVLGHPAPSPENRPRAGYDDVSPSIFQTLHIPLKKGRYLDEHDTQTAPWAVVINEALARKYFPNEDPVGQQIVLRYDPYPVEEERPRQIVGVVGDVKHFGLGQEVPPFLYASYLQQQAVFPGGTAIPHLHHYVVIRRASGAGQDNGLAGEVKEAIAKIDPDLPVTEISSMENVISESMGDYRLYMQLLAVFAGVAAVLAAIGIYGVMSYFVSERTREIGIRVALGAGRGDVLKLIAKLGLKLALLGVAAGLALTFGLTRFIAAFLYGVKATDPLTCVIVAVGLIGVALLACYVPARRALRVDPIIALRYE
ncbi:MAG TPA: ABC transporter permease [Candidatus Acidoferrum sp.]|nr:ABC transporter permease [Candidatus Acidoferrum sp.]